MEVSCLSRPLARRGLDLCSWGTMAAKNGCRSTVTINASVRLFKCGTNMKVQNRVHGNRNKTLKTKACKLKTRGRWTCFLRRHTFLGNTTKDFVKIDSKNKQNSGQINWQNSWESLCIPINYLNIKLSWQRYLEIHPHIQLKNRSVLKDSNIIFLTKKIWNIRKKTGFKIPERERGTKAS